MEESGWELDDEGFVCTYYELDGAAFLRDPGRHQERCTKKEFMDKIEEISPPSCLGTRLLIIHKLIRFLFQNSNLKFKED